MTKASAPRCPRWPARQWFRARFIVICLAAAATTLVLGGTDIAIVAALRDFDAQSSIGWVLAVWGFGSLLGGLVYGGVQKSISAFWLLGGLAVVSAPMALGRRRPLAGPVVLRGRVVLRADHHGDRRPGEPGGPGRVAG